MSRSQHRKTPILGIRTLILVPAILSICFYTLLIVWIDHSTTTRQVDRLALDEAVWMLDTTMREVTGQADMVLERVYSLSKDPQFLKQASHDEWSQLRESLPAIASMMGFEYLEVMSSSLETRLTVGERFVAHPEDWNLPSYQAYRLVPVGGGLVVAATVPVSGGQAGYLEVQKLIGIESLMHRSNDIGLLVVIMDSESVVAASRGAATIVAGISPQQITRQPMISVPSPGDQTRYAMASEPLGNGGLMMILTPVSRVEEASRAKIVTTGLVALLCGAACIGGTYLGSRTIGNAVKNMVLTIRQMAGGDLDALMPLSFVGELNQLSEATLDLAEQIKAQMAEVTHQAFHDSLTGLPNRALFMDRLQQALSRCKRRNLRVCVVFLDLDDFKLINDNYGHSAGDTVLISVAKRILSAIRAEDTLARIGGDEFTLLLEDIEDLATATQVSDRIERVMSEPFVIRGQEHFVSMSMGLVLSEANELNGEILLSHADIALYTAKEHGKSRCEVFQEKMLDSSAQRLQLETELRRALERSEFVMYYQPIVDMASLTVVGFEALIRWKHPIRGLLLPDQFLPHAEQNGMILPIGRWVFQEVCRQIREWGQIPDKGGLRMFVNLSARQFQQPMLVEDIKKMLRETGVRPDQVVLEITESAAVKDLAHARKVASELTEAGIALTVDDFGTGYSSLNYLMDFPVSGLKIDRSFVERLGCSSSNDAIVKHIISLAGNLNLDVVGEGIETIEQARVLASLGCSLGQGFYYHRPMPSESASDTIG